jgi:xanthine dehydrogenase YagS FAD-binding subunit
MHTFEFIRPADAAASRTARGGRQTAQQGADVRFVAGGHDPDRFDETQRRSACAADRHQPLATDKIEATPDGGLKIGATVRNSDLAHHPTVQRDYAVLSQALSLARRYSFATWRRLPATCSSEHAVHVLSRHRDALQQTRARNWLAVRHHRQQPHARRPSAQVSIVATSPSDMCVAMAALEATIHVQGPKGTREIAIGDFHLLPGSTPDRETVLEPGDLVTHVTLPPARSGSKQMYLKLRDRASYEFALASAAVVISLGGGNVTQARIALGGVGTKPWRSREAEAALGSLPLPTFARRQKRQCATPSRRAKTSSRSSWPSGASRTPCKWQRRADSAERTNMPKTQEAPFGSPVGRDTPRVEGPRKVSGVAEYTSDFHFPGMLYAVPVEATIANGRVVKVDTTAAEKMPACARFFIARTSGRSSARS